MYSFSEINDATGFANGDMFDSEEQVREYFTLETMQSCFGGDWSETGLTQDDLDAMAETIIQNGWHMKPTYRGKCIMLNRSESGTYSIPGAAEMESWDEVRAEADTVERYDTLIGWGPWNAVYRLVVDGCELWYAVREERIYILRDRGHEVMGAYRTRAEAEAAASRMTFADGPVFEVYTDIDLATRDDLQHERAAAREAGLL